MEVISASEEQWTDIITNSNFPGLVVLGLGSLPAMFFLVRWMMRFQKEFTDFYIQENKKLRERIDTLELEIQKKDDLTIELRNELGHMKNELKGCKSTIGYLQKRLERRDYGGK
jgi:predicted nuclease with TOPRIM domain